jgi:hypothetical protein
MNEKIRELAEQADAYAHLTGEGMMYQKTRERYTEKFAELIVKECAKFLDENSGYDDANNAWHPEPEELLEHFGVKE